jgi:hypothetical protein
MLLKGNQFNSKINYFLGVDLPKILAYRRSQRLERV